MDSAQKQSLSTSEKGRQGEQRAIHYLIEKNYTIIETNWRIKAGEIDIIAEKDDLLIFVEVKTIPKGNSDTLAALLDVRKQEKILKTAKYYLQNNRQYSKHYIRFDVISIGLSCYEDVHHIENAFLE